MENGAHTERSRFRSQLNMDFRLKVNDTSVASQHTANHFVEQIEVLQAELKFRIHENENLQRKLRDLELVHEKEMYGLAEKMKVIQQEADRWRRDLENAEMGYREHQDFNGHMQICDLKPDIPISQHEGMCTGCSNLTSCESLNSDSLGNVKEQQPYHDILIDMLPVVVLLTENYSNLFSFYDCRSRFFICNTLLSLQLAQLLRKVRKNFDAVACELSNSTVSSTQDFKTTFKRLTKCFTEQKECLTSLGQLIIACIDEECLVPSCGTALEAVNKRFASCLEDFIEATCSVIDMATEQHCTLELRTPNFLSVLTRRFGNLVNSGSALSSCLSDKVLMEHELPNATKKLRTDNECFASCLSSIVRNSSEVVRYLESLLSKVSQLDTEVPRVLSIECDNGSAQACNDEFDNPVIRRLTSEVANLKNQVAELERDKCCLEAEVGLSALRLERTKTTNNSNLPTGADEVNRVRSMYQAQIEALVRKVQMCQGRTTYFQNEIEDLSASVQVLDAQKVELENHLRQSEERVALLMDELERTRRGYENQLSSLSEHMAQMNQRIATQADEIDLLRAFKKKA
uniref:Protein phosphatase 1 regulatory subunit 21 C-terminal domain-containing protein n=1 Tax=Trichuris muris TaxID=70415 RepID=A0A5S6PZ15_TRIMR